MQVTDSIADMLTRIRNANQAKLKTVDIPLSKTKKTIAQILLEQGFIRKVEYINTSVQGAIRITLKYFENKKRVITGLKRVSKPGLRIYSSKSKLPYVLRGLGVAIISTSKGVVTDRKARRQNLGGEVLAYVW